jgi:hypothetical protein
MPPDAPTELQKSYQAILRNKLLQRLDAGTEALGGTRLGRRLGYSEVAPLKRSLSHGGRGAQLAGVFGTLAPGGGSSTTRNIGAHIGGRALADLHAVRGYEASTKPLRVLNRVRALKHLGALTLGGYAMHKLLGD